MPPRLHARLYLEAIITGVHEDKLTDGLKVVGEPIKGDQVRIAPAIAWRVWVKRAWILCIRNAVIVVIGILLIRYPIVVMVFRKGILRIWDAVIVHVYDIGCSISVIVIVAGF
jgi:hypothetical protein